MTRPSPRHTVPDMRAQFAKVGGAVQRNWRPDRLPHHVLLGLSGAGKSHMIRYGILPQAGPLAAVVVIDVKPGGDAAAWDGWGNDVPSARELPCPLTLGPDKSCRWRIVHPGGLTAADVGRVLEQLGTEAAVILVMDDASSIIESGGQRGGMGLSGPVDTMLRQGRTHDLTLILGLNSTAWAGGAKNLAGTTWLGYTGNADMRAEFAKVAGLPPAIRPALDGLLPKEWLYSAVDETAGLHVYAITRAPAAS